MKSEDQAATPTPAAILTDEPGGRSLEQVRDILFGSQARDYDRRLQRLEDRILEEIGDLKQEAQKGLETLDLYVRQEFESLASRLKSEQDERTAADKELAKEQDRRSAEHDKRIAKLDEQLAQAERALRQHILDQAKSLREEMQANQTQIRQALDQEAGDLRATKTDRTALGELLMQMAMRLNDDGAMADGD
jgi:hypothetical protein